MLCIYESSQTTARVISTDEIKTGCWVNLEAPTQDEIRKVCEQANISPDFIEYALDREEKPRFDRDDAENTKFVLIDVPVKYANDDTTSYDTLPLGMIVVRDDIFITISLENTDVVNRFKNGYRWQFSTKLKSRFVLQLFYEAASSYLKCLKELNKEKDDVERDLSETYKRVET